MDEDYGLWLTEVMQNRPKQPNIYLDSKRGVEVTKLCFALNKEFFAWRRSDPDTFWIDVQMYVKYKLSDEEISFTENLEPGVEQFKKHSKEKNAYAEMMRGMNKLKELNKKNFHK